MSETDIKVGNVSQQRYEEIVAELTGAVAAESVSRWLVGDRALEIEPLRRHGGSLPNGDDDLVTVEESLHRLSEDIGVPYNTVKKRRWTSSRWPSARRRRGVSHYIHQILAAIRDEEERCAAIDSPPLDERTGRRRWTPDSACRKVGYRASRPQTPTEKVRAIHDLAVDDRVAAQVAADLLHRPEVAAQVPAQARSRVIRDLAHEEHVAASAAADLLQRPDVAFKAMSDDRARQMVNRAQVEHGRQAREHFERTSPMAPPVKRVEHTMEFLELVGACHAFVARASRTVPGLRDRVLAEDERTVLHANVSSVRATLEWIDQAVDTGRVDMDEELARLLRGE
ncbi:DUF6192 family protein [Streptomyces cinnamoneus]|nr:DUF6192 family protein [Streptomyces cinnamoneus]